MIKAIITSIAVLLISVSAFGKEKLPEKLSLPEATVVTGLPALGITSIIFLYKFDYTFSESLDNFKNGFGPPVWDKNPWYVNYVGHPHRHL
jgi:hypothetical protein